MDNEKFVNNLCLLVKARNFIQAERILLHLISDSVSHSNGIASLDEKRKFIREIYSSFNNIYHVWLRKNKLNINNECKKLSRLGHPNYLISHTRDFAEMDDLLYGLINFNNTTMEKRELISNLQCYRTRKAS